MINFFDSSYVDSTPISQKNGILESMCHYGSFRVCDSESFDCVKKKIDIYLNSQEKRFEGLVLLKTVTDQCSAVIFQQNVLTWADTVLKALQHRGESSGSRKLSYGILKEILWCMLNFPPLKHEANTTLLPRLIDVLLESSVDDEWIEPAAECLSACMQCFPGSCGLKKDKIEEFLIVLLDKWELKQFEPIAVCFAYLPTCGLEGKDRSSNFKKMWTEQFKQFIGVLNAILNFLYDGVENGCGDIKICSSKQLPPVPDEPFPAVLKLVHRFKAFGLCLSKMLVSTSHIEVIVPVDALLGFLSRTLQMTPTQMERNLMIYSVLPVLYLTALTVLEAFILSCDQQLMSDCHLVSRFIIQAIKSCSLKASSSNDFLSVVRGSAYRCLQLYVEKFKLFGVPENHIEYLVSAMINDMKPSVYEVKLELPSASRSVLQSQPMETPENGKHPRSCITSNEAIKGLMGFVSCGNLDNKNFEEIYTVVVDALTEINVKPQDLPVPYSDDNYRLGLYCLMHTLLLNYKSEFFICLPNSLSLATGGCHDSSSEVRSKIREILDATNTLVNIVKDVPPDSPSVETVSDEKTTLNGELYSQVPSNSSNIYSMPRHIVIQNECSTADASPCVEMVNGVLPAVSVKETLPSHNELHDEPAKSDTEITVHEEGSGENMYFGNANAYSPSEVEEEEMEVEEEEEEEEFSKEESYANQNGFSSEEESVSEDEEEDLPNKRHSSPDVQNTRPISQKVVRNDIEDHSEPDVQKMLGDFIPGSPDQS